MTFANKEENRSIGLVVVIVPTLGVWHHEVVEKLETIAFAAPLLVRPTLCETVLRKVVPPK